MMIFFMMIGLNRIILVIVRIVLKSIRNIIVNSNLNINRTSNHKIRLNLKLIIFKIRIRSLTNNSNINKINFLTLSNYNIVNHRSKKLDHKNLVLPKK